MNKGPNKNIAIVLAGGSGERFGEPIPKQFISMGGKPLMAYCLLALQESPLIDEIYVVTAKGYLDKTRDLLHSFHIAKSKAVIEGGETRKESSYRGLLYLRRLHIDPDSIVLICDADRPNLSQALIRENIEAAQNTGAAVTAMQATDSILFSRQGAVVNEYFPRRMVFQAQTPQTFRYDIIFSAHRKAAKSSSYDLYTDDASLVKALKSVKIAIVEGSQENLKINTRNDEAAFVMMRRDRHE
ncbi:MAG: 2-C-methyl-D-erythritol 4-phosphate cytidylyltransferase [Bacilli bacterium]|nr:2-C-methyl-D-erythritol 4-phosphate cytidylyltransferase [Bacilli bacterium]